MHIKADDCLADIAATDDYSIICFTADGLIKSWNNGAEKMTGYSHAAVVTKPLSLLYTDQDSGMAAALLQNAALHGKVAAQHWRLKKDGTIFWADIRLTAVKDGSGEVTGFTEITANHTDKKQTADALKAENEELRRWLQIKTNEAHETKNRFQALIENSHDGISLISPAGEIMYVTPSIERILGYRYAELLGLTSLDFFHPDNKQEIAVKLKELTNHPGKTIVTSYRVRHKDTTWRWIRANITNMLNVADINAFVFNFEDITARVLAEEKKARATRLYAFISQINQAIVYANDTATLYDRACRIAIDTGKFNVAMISEINPIAETINVAASYGLTPENIQELTNIHFEPDGPISTLLKTGQYYLCNNVEHLAMPRWQAFAKINGRSSFIILPVTTSGIVVASFILCSEEPYFFDTTEIALLHEAAGDISFALGVFEKEAQRIAAETKLKHNEQRLKQAQSIASFGSWQLDFLTGVATWSEEACNMYGLPTHATQHSYNEWESFLHPDDKNDVLQVIAASRHTMTDSSSTHRIIRKDGQVRYIQNHTRFEFDKDGVPIGLYGVEHDITERKIAENVLRQSEANLRLIMDLIPQAIFVKDSNGKYLFVNKSFAAIYALTPKELMAKSRAGTPIAEDNTATQGETDREVIKTGTTKTIAEMSLTDHKGNKRIYYTTKVPYTPAGKAKKGALTIALDITSQKNADLERATIIKDLIQRNKDLEQFSYIVSHNLRSPIANIIGLSELWHLAGQNPQEDSETLQMLFASVNKLDGVIRDLNDILQVKHQINEKREQVRFSRLLADIRHSIDHLLRDDTIHINSDFSAIDELETIKSYMYSIFINLITNSIKYRQAHIPLSIDITSERKGKKILLTFKDNGIGIDLTRKSVKLFGLYRRFHNHTEGKGMGLYMVKAQVETLGGKISATSAVNVGIEFKIELDIVH